MCLAHVDDSYDIVVFSAGNVDEMQIDCVLNNECRFYYELNALMLH